MRISECLNDIGIGIGIGSATSAIGMLSELF
jgi:hypothetical protein